MTMASKRASDSGSDVLRHRSRSVLEMCALLVFVFMAGQILLGGARIGVSNDESVHQARMSTWFETGWYVPMRFIDASTGDPDPVFDDRKHTYGAAYSIVAHGFNALIGAEEPGRPNREARAYIGRSLVVAFLGIAASAALAFALAVVTKSRTVGLWTGAALLALPAWAGYSMFAVKDVPAATGWTLLTAGLTVALVPGHAWRRPVAVGVLCLSGVWFSFGVRTALWVVVTTALATFAVLAFSSLDRPDVRRNVVGAVAGSIAGFLAVAALHYRNAATLPQWLGRSVSSARDFEWTGATLTAGELVTESPPWWYLPSWIFGSMPVLIVGLATAGVGLIAVSLFRQGEGGRPIRGRLGTRQATALLWCHQALLLPIAATVAGSTMYAGLRQHLYVLPALVALGGMAAWSLLRMARQPWAAVATTTLLTISLVAPAAEQTRLFPYNYTYKNIIAGPVGERWEADMHWTSRREALGRVPQEAEGFHYTRATRMLSGRIRAPRLNIIEDSRALGPFASQQGSQAAPSSGDGVWVIARRYRGSPPPVDCIEHDNVTRPLRGEHIVMSYVLLCDPSMLPDG